MVVIEIILVHTIVILIMVGELHHLETHTEDLLEHIVTIVTIQRVTLVLLIVASGAILVEVHLDHLSVALIGQAQVLHLGVQVDLDQVLHLAAGAAQVEKSKKYNLNMTLYNYKAKVVRIVDGDTFIAMIDQGFDTYSSKYVRLAGINTPELTSSDPVIRANATKAKFLLETLLPVGTEFYLDSKKLDPYRRPIAVILLPNQIKSINDQMLESGLAEIYPKKTTTT